MDMGFNKEEVLYALSLCNNDIELAKHILTSNDKSIPNNSGNSNDLNLVMELLQSGFSLNEARNAINMSKNINLYLK